MSNALRGKIKYNKLTGKLNVGKEYVQPTGTININSNGTFDVAKYGVANVLLTVDDVENKIIHFVDYNGTQLYDIPLSELSELPPLPQHDGLICQGWNWTLDELKEENTSMHVGPWYITNDGATRLYIHLNEDELNVYFNFDVSSGIEKYIDWGDGSARWEADTTVSGRQMIEHSFPIAGDYVVSFGADQNKSIRAFSFTGYSEKPGMLCCKTGISGAGNSVDTNNSLMHIIYKIEFGTPKHLSLANASFSYATNLSEVCVPQNRTFYTTTFFNCSSLKTIICNGSLDQRTLYGTGLELLITSPNFNGYKYGLNTVTYDLPPSLEFCHIPSGCTAIPDLSKTRVILKKIPNKTVALGPTKPEDHIYEVPETVREFYDRAMVGYKSKRFVFKMSPGFHTKDIFRENIFIEEVEYPETISMTSNWSTFNYTFYGCRNLKRVVLPKNGVTTLGSYTFNNCVKLNDVQLGNTITLVGTYTFNGCSSLKNITLPDTVKMVANNSFSNCTALEEINITDKITSIGNYAFHNCYSLKSELDLTNVEALSYYAFASCRSLTSIKLSKVATSIGQYCFSGCTSLSYVYIPPNIITFSNYAFHWNTGIIIKQVFDFRDHTTIPTLGTAVFGKQSGLKIVVPDELYDTWITTENWTGYTSYIIKASDYTE